MWNNTTIGDGNSGFFNQADSSQPKTKTQLRRTQSVVPVCIRQIRDNPDDEFKLFGMHTQILKLVGVLKASDVQSTKATYEIEDHTGKIKAIWWLENDNNTNPTLPPVKEGFYLKLFGSLRVQDGEKLLMVLKMFPIDNPNKVTSHLLEVIHTRFEAEALSKGPGVLAKIKQNNPGAQLINSMSFMDTNMEQSIHSGFTSIQQKVYDLLRGTSENGIHRINVLQKFPPNQHREVNHALEFLTNEGHAYSTIDTDHFKATDSM